MSDQPILNPLVVDRSLTDIDDIAKALRDAGYVVQQLLHSDQESVIRDYIRFKPLDLILVRVADDLPQPAKVNGLVDAAEKDIPVLALLDDDTVASAFSVLKTGADNLCNRQDHDHLIHVVNKEIAQLRIRQQVHSYETRLKETEARSRALMNSVRDAIAYIHEGAHIYANPVYLEMFGYPSEEELEGVTLMNMVIRKDQNSLKSYLRDTMKGKELAPLNVTGLSNDSKEFPVLMRCIPTHINEEPCLQIIIQGAGGTDPQAEQELEERKKALQREMEEVRRRDPLTGLYNRHYFTEHLQALFSGKGRREGAVIYILLNDYRSLSDDPGLEAVDQLLQDLGKLIDKKLSIKGSYAAHFSDAVFTVFVPVKEKEEAIAFAEELNGAIAEHASHAANRLITTTTSMGIGMVQEDHGSALHVLSTADRACEEARKTGTNRIEVYSPKVSLKNPQEEALAELIRDALKENRLALRFQAIANFQNGEEQRYKAYLRMTDNEGKLVPMDRVGAVAQQANLMGKLDRWTLGSALEKLTTVYQDKGQTAVLFVRISENSIAAQKEFLPWLAKQIKDTGLSGNMLVIEIPEESGEKYFKETKVLRDNLRKLGCGFALSHFGGKPNSDRILKHLHPDYAKLDISLIEKLAKTKDEASRNAMATISEQTQEADAKIIAADMTNPNQMANIWQFGVTLMQGDVVHQASEEMDFDFQEFSG